jgi:hypothetical protein
LANKLKQNLLALNQQDLLTAGTGNSQAIVYDSAFVVILFFGLIKEQCSLKMLF